jgi:hypothetical protein
MSTNNEDEADEADERYDVHEEIVEVLTFVGKPESIFGVVKHHIMLQEERLSQNDSIIEGLFDVESQFLALEMCVHKVRYRNVDVLATKIKENSFF